MSKAPAMPMYWDAYLADTTHLTTEEHGAYMLLLAAMWRRNSWVPDDDKDNARIVGVTPAKWRKIKARLVDTVSGLRIADGRITQEKLQKVWENTQENICKNRANGAKGGRPKSKENNDLAKPNGFVSVNPNETIPYPEPYKSLKLTDSSVPKGTGEIADFHKRAIFSNGVRFLASHGRSEADARKIIGRWLKGNSAEAVFKAFADAKDASAVDPVSYIGRLLVGRENERLKGHGIEVGGGNTRKSRNISPGPEWDTKVDLSEVQPSAETDQQACEVHVGDIPDEWNRLELSSLRTQGG